MTVEQLSTFRFVVFLLAGGIIASYGLFALLWNTPQPFWAWVPTVAGLSAAAIIWISARRAGHKVAGATFDELYSLEWSRAVRVAYWFAILLYPVFAIFLIAGHLNDGVAFAAMGTLTGAAPLLAFCVITLRG